MAKARVMYFMPVWGKHIGMAIAGYTWLFNWFTKWFSHVELWTPNEKGRFEDLISVGTDIDYSMIMDIDWSGDMFTSTMGQTGGKNRKGSGVVLRPASEVLKHPERWWYQEIEIPDEKLASLRTWTKYCADHNKGYDKRAILGFFLPFRLHRKDQFMCQEAVWTGLWLHEILTAQKIFSPRRMSKRIYKYCTCPITEIKKLVPQVPEARRADD